MTRKLAHADAPTDGKASPRRLSRAGPADDLQRRIAIPSSAILAVRSAPASLFSSDAIHSAPGAARWLPAVAATAHASVLDMLVRSLRRVSADD
jgi:hypothetical protein